MSRLRDFALSRFGFLAISTPVFGLPLAAFLAWYLAIFDKPALLVILLALALVGGWLWGLGMWAILGDEFGRREPGAGRSDG